MPPHWFGSTAFLLPAVENANKTTLPHGIILLPSAVSGDQISLKTRCHSTNQAQSGRMIDTLFNPIQLALGLHGESVPPELSEDGLKFSPLKARYGFHSLRHFYAGLIIEEGFIPKRVQELMGQST